MNGLDRSSAALVRVSAELARGAEGELDDPLRRAAEACPSRAVEEALLQSYLFLGFPVALNGLAHWRRVSGESPPPVEGTGWEAWERRGAETCGRVYGDQRDALRENISALSPEMERWMVVEGYGKVLGRPGLDLATRELCIVAVLVVTGHATQLYSHLRGALRTGAPSEAVEATLEIALEVAPERRELTFETWNRLRTRSE